MGRAFKFKCGRQRLAAAWPPREGLVGGKEKLSAQPRSVGRKAEMLKGVSSPSARSLLQLRGLGDCGTILPFRGEVSSLALLKGVSTQCCLPCLDSDGSVC